MATAQDIITAAYYEINYVPVGQVPLSPDLTVGLNRLNLILDTYNADPSMRFSSAGATVQFQPGASGTVSIGPGLAAPNINAQAPIQLVRGTITYPLGAPNPVIQELRIMDSFAFRDLLRVGNLTGIPTTLVVNNTWPNMDLQLYPVPSLALSLELLWQTEFTPYQLTDTIVLPPGFQKLLTLQLALELAPGCEAQVSTVTNRAYEDALAIVKRQIAKKRYRFLDPASPIGTSTGRFSYRTGIEY